MYWVKGAGLWDRSMGGRAGGGELEDIGLGGRHRIGFQWDQTCPGLPDSLAAPSCPATSPHTLPRTMLSAPQGLLCFS